MIAGTAAVLASANTGGGNIIARTAVELASANMARSSAVAKSVAGAPLASGSLLNRTESGDVVVRVLVLVEPEMKS